MGVDEHLNRIIADFDSRLELHMKTIKELSGEIQELKRKIQSFMPLFQSRPISRTGLKLKSGILKKNWLLLKRQAIWQPFRNYPQI